MSVIPLIDALTPVVNKALSFISDPQQRAEQEQFLINSLKDWDSQQTAINAQEATNANLFVSGWRPFIGWVCGIAFAYHFVVQPLLIFVLAELGHDPILPEFDMEELSTVLLGLLGLGGLRTLEKINIK